MAMNGALNDAQTAAVASASPRTLVLAGAGTGKTMTLAYRVAALLADGWPPSSILALTLTRRAAAQMAERVASPAGPAALEEMWLGTIHAICYRVLCEHGHRIGYPEAPSVYGEEDAKAVLESVLTGLDLRCSLRQAGEAMRHGTADRDLRRAVAEYRRQLKVACAVDYDGLLTAALELLDIPEVRDGYRARFPHVLVDEVQDLFPASWSLLDKLAPEHLYLVGDDAQSIYGWLGASMDRLLALPGVGYAVHTLTRCYRCTRPVLALGNAILRQNARRLKKTLVTDKDGEPVCAKGFPDDEAEAAGVAAGAGRPYDGGAPGGPPRSPCSRWGAWTRLPRRPAASWPTCCGPPSTRTTRWPCGASSWPPGPRRRPWRGSSSTATAGRCLCGRRQTVCRAPRRRAWSWRWPTSPRPSPPTAPRPSAPSSPACGASPPSPSSAAASSPRPSSAPSGRGGGRAGAPRATCWCSSPPRPPSTSGSRPRTP